MSFIFSLGTIFIPYKFKKYTFFSSVLSSIIAFLLLILAFILFDFSLKNIFLNSSTIQPFIYRIAASWASYEGSIMLWLGLLSLVSFFYIYFFPMDTRIDSYRITIISIVKSFFSGFIYFAVNIFEKFQNKPSEGLGLNPVLQDFALAVHPPLIYLGQVTYIVLFTNGYLLLFFPDFRKKILLISKFFLNFGLFFLSLGIGLGSWWAYREFGWGGFWFFDPVENISLLPWLCGICLYHFLVITIKSDKYLRSSICFSILSFLLVLYSIFFIRSTIISSIHSFAFNNNSASYLLLVSIIMTILSIVVFMLKKDNVTFYQIANIQEKYVLFANILWCLSLISLLIGIIYPIYIKCFYNLEIMIDPEYYITIFIPIFIPIVIIGAITPQIMNAKYSKYLFYLILITITTFIVNKFIKLNLIECLLVFASSYLLIQTLDFFFVVINPIKNKIDMRRLALFVGHLGFGILVLSITLNTILSTETQFIGKIGDVVDNKNFTIKLEDIKFSKSYNYYQQIVIFSVYDKYRNNYVLLQPENRLYKIENALSYEASIYSYFFYDLYAILNKIEDGIIYAEIYYKPFISIIWFSVALIAISFIISLLKGNKFIKF